MSNTWKQKYDRMFEKARRKRQELEERIAELEVQAHNRNEHISDLESKVEALEAENARLAAMLGEIANYIQNWKNWRAQGDD